MPVLNGKKPPVELVPLPDNTELTVEYAELIGYELDGDDNYRVGKLRKVYSVAELLNGIEKPETRQNSANPHLHTHYHYGDYNEEKKAVEIKNQTINGGKQQFADKIENYSGDKNMTTINQNITGDNNTVHGQIVAEKIEHSLNSLHESKANKEVKELLVQLLKELYTLNKNQPELQILEDMSRDVEMLISESDREAPRKRWYEASLEGIKETALTVGEAAKPILEIAEKLSPLLLG
jgi:hypothetical protein